MSLTARFQKRYGSFLLDVDLSAGSGEPLALLGASGSGKSVTLKCIAGIDKPDRGQIVLDGRVLFDSNTGVNLPPQKRRIGFLFQQYALFPNMTVRENIAVCLGRIKGPRRQRETEALLSMFRLKGLENLYPRQLSGGQQQRTALARILAAEPQAILLDEPLSALDSFLKWRLELELGEALERFPGPVLWVSHDLGEVCRNCRRVSVLEAGRSAPATELNQLLETPGTISAARLCGCKNFAALCPGPGPEMVQVPEWGLTLRSAAPWREGITTLGIRGDRLHLAAPGEANAFPCRVLRVTEDAGGRLVTLRPEGTEGLLWMELPKGRPLPEEARLEIAVSPEDLMLLR